MPAQWLEGAGVGGLLEVLEVVFPVVTEQSVLESHVGDLKRRLDFYRAGSTETNT